MFLRLISFLLFLLSCLFDLGEFDWLGAYKVLPSSSSKVSFIKRCVNWAEPFITTHHFWHTLPCIPLFSPFPFIFIFSFSYICFEKANTFCPVAFKVNSLSVKLVQTFACKFQRLIGWNQNVAWAMWCFTFEISAAQLRCSNRPEITVLVCEQKLYPVWFSCGRKSYLL